MGAEAQQTATAAGDTATAENKPATQTAQSPSPAQGAGEADNSILNPQTPAPDPGKGGDDGQNKGDGQDSAILTPEAGEDDKQPESQGAPEQYADFKMPEGFTLEGETKEKVTGLFRELNLSQENAQKLIDYATERDIANKEAMLNDLSARRKEWRSTLRARPNFESDLALARKGMKALVQTPEGAELFKDTWMSDHPAVFDMFVRAGKLVAEDSFDNQNGGGAEENVNLKRFPVK